ncbi:MAG: glycosyltransferase involved in cell wall biosynthesis [Saprospiraceae bacterium]|jgi:glycosyltransferase involved in cell wall biosynthesis
MKKILVISNYRGFHTARPEAEIFIGLSKLGFDITIMTYPDAEYIKRFEENGVRVIPIHPSKRYDKKFILLLKEEINRESYDILQLYNNKAISNGIQAAKNLPIKIVIYRGASSNMAWYNPINYLKFFHPRIDYVVCNSEEIRQQFLKVPFYNKDKAVTIFKGHDTEWYRGAKPHNIRAELDIPADALIFVTVANNRRFKAIPDLIKAIKFLPTDTAITFLIIGEGMDTPQIRTLTSDSCYQDKVHFLGYRNESLNIVAACNAFVLPSIGGESLTKSVVEAMSLGVVPIISDIEGNRPLVKNLVNGYIFKKANPRDLADTILMAYNNRHSLPDFSKAAKLKIDRDINSAKTIIEYSDFYNRIS